MIAFRSLLISFASASLLALAACGSQSSSESGAKNDAAGLALAIAAPMMTDPELTNRNLAGSAIAGGGAPVMVQPPFNRDAEAAEQEAETLSGGAIAAAPPGNGDVDTALRDAVAAAQRAAAIKGPGKDCGGKADYAMAWSLKLPAVLPIYPRGNLIEAAGSDQDGCQLRVVRFVTPVEPEALIDFYYARARAAGFVMRHHASAEIHQLAGAKAAGAFAVQASKREDGLTEADIVANGL